MPRHLRLGGRHRPGAPVHRRGVPRAWDAHCAPGDAEPDGVLAALRGGEPEALAAALHNDLEPAAFALRPELAAAKEALLEAGALGAVLSGSGPTLLGLCADDEAAAAVADRVRDGHREVFPARSPAGVRTRWPADAVGYAGGAGRSMGGGEMASRRPWSRS